MALSLLAFKKAVLRGRAAWAALHFSSDAVYLLGGFGVLTGRELVFVLNKTFVRGFTTLTFLPMLTLTLLAVLSFLAGGCTGAGEEEEEGSSCKSVPGGGLRSALFQGFGLMASVLSFR